MEPDTARVELDRVRRTLLAPKRDWRFWAAVCAALLAFTTTVAFAQILSDRNNWRDRFDDQRTETLCRSAETLTGSRMAPTRASRVSATRISSSAVRLTSKRLAA